MANKLYEESHIQDIAIALREQNGTATKYKVSQMGAAIRAIQTGVETSEYIWDQTPTAVKNFIENVIYDSSDYTTSQIADYAPSTANVNNTYPIGITVKTENGILDRDGYETTVSSGDTTLYNDIPNRYTGYVNRNNGTVSRVGTLKPTGTLRQIKCATPNVRDLGGWPCDGGTVKYGKLFRGGEFNAADVDIFINQLGIRHELNLRGISEAESERTILSNYVNFTCPEDYVWYTIIGYDEAWKEIIRCVFDAVKNNTPLYFHCSAGADRTGTVACVLETILGMNQSDIDKDYELSSFYTGTATDNTARQRNEDDWSNLIRQINYLTVGSTFRDKIINWIASLGFTADEINAYRMAMIDGTPDTITLDIGTYTVTNSIGAVETDNTTTEVMQYQPYEANIIAPEGRAIANLKITMGGEDVTYLVFKGYETTINRAVVKNLTNCTLDNTQVVVIDGQGYVANLIANDGYALEGAEVTITMGGKNMAAYYYEGKIAIPKVTGNIVITAEAIESASAVETVPIVWKNGYTVGYTENTVCTETESSSYFISELIPVEYGKTYAFTIDITTVENNAFRFIGVNDSNVVTEAINNQNYTNGLQTFTFSPKSGTTGLRLRGYSSEFTCFSAVTELTVV